MTKRIAILGSTGSIGRQSLDVIDGLPDVRVCALAAGQNHELLLEQARRTKPQFVSIGEQTAAAALAAELPGITVLCGPQGLEQLVRQSRPDILLNGMVGSAGLAPTLAGIDCGATLAIANKETLVMAGAVVMPAARNRGVAVLPVDSEHSAIFQCLKSGSPQEVRRVVITASGGALRDFDEDCAHHATVEQALNHPTWRMGRKITIDSATLMNKALEVVEAHWLFDLPPEKIDVVLHPESIVHSYVEFCDGSVIAQLAAPDMTLPICYALAYPARAHRNTPPLDLAAIGKLTFRPLPPRFKRAVALGYQAVRQGGVAGAVLNAANESAVEAFLAGKIKLGSVVCLVERVLNASPNVDNISLQALLEADAWARARVQRELAG